MSASSVVLGHSGFVGGALMSELQSRGADPTGLSSREVNLRDPAAFSGLDSLLGVDTSLYVCAAITPDRGATIDACLDHVAMTGNLARYLSQHDVRRCIFLSSDAVYPMISTPVDEDTPVGPSGAYPVAKYTSECLMQMAFAQNAERLLIVRPAAVFGPGDTHNSYGPNRFIRTAVADRSVRLFGQGEEERDHLYLDDLTRILVDLGTSDASGVLNIATGTSRSFGSIVEQLRSFAPIEVIHAPRSGPITHRTFNIDRLRNTIPRLEFTPFEDALRLTYDAASAAQVGA